MEISIFSSVARQSALKSEMSIIANNLANSSTSGFLSQEALHTEFIKQPTSRAGSISMSTFGAHYIDTSQGALKQTGGTLDFAIDGNGFFQIQGQGETLLTRSGAFTKNEIGEIVTMQGQQLLDSGGAAILVPQGTTDLSLASDGTLVADQNPIAQVGVFKPASDTDLLRVGKTAFRTTGELEQVVDSTLHQGFLENSNVNPLEEIARMIEVQRRYETAKSFAEREHDRVTSVVETLGR